MTDEMLPADDAPDATAEHHDENEGPAVDTSHGVVTFDVDEATGADAPDEDDEDGE